jgi:hypothetical protein
LREKTNPWNSRTESRASGVRTTMPELDVFPIAVRLENRSRLQLPFEEGAYSFPRGKKPCRYTVHIEAPKPDGRQTVLVCFNGVDYDSKRSPNFQVDLKRIEYFYETVVTKKRDLKTTMKPLYKDTHFEEVSSGNLLRRTRSSKFKEDVAVYELAVEAVNELLLAAKCAVWQIYGFPLFDENYFSAVYHHDSWFYHFVPEFYGASRVRRRKFPMAIGLPSGFFLVSQKDFKTDVLEIFKNRREYALEEMIVSANKAFDDGEHEASLVLLEAVFEAKVKECITEYYERRPFKSEAARKEKLNNLLNKNKGIRELLNEEYPKCKDARWFCEGVVEFEKWHRIYSQRNDIAHSLQKKGRLSKEEALVMFSDFNDIFLYLFGIKTSCR